MYTTTKIITLIRLYASLYGIDPDLAVAVAKHESMLNPYIVGLVGEVGVMQVNPHAHPKYSLKRLQDVKSNIKIGLYIMKYMKDNCIHQDKHAYIVCYNRGENGGAKVKNPYKDEYYVKVMKHYNELKGVR